LERETNDWNDGGERLGRPSVYRSRMGRTVDVEAELSGLVGDGELDSAATRAIEAYGPELFGFLAHLLGQEQDAAEVFSQLSEDLWSGLPGFRGQCSMRTWLYALARHAAARFLRSPWNARARRVSDSRLEGVPDETRSRTQPWLRTDVRDRWSALRDALDPDDRSLLVLRVDRELPWEDIAWIMLGAETADPVALGKENDRLRKRFQHLKRELRRRAEESGLLDEEA
jgi:RNA polymerase sigma-70 factor, ECF subfamily